MTIEVLESLVQRVEVLFALTCAYLEHERKCETKKSIKSLVSLVISMCWLCVKHNHMLGGAINPSNLNRRIITIIRVG